MRLGLRSTTRFHTWLYRATGGKVGGRVGHTPILLLTATGRKSRMPRTTPLGFVRLDDRLVVCGANLGSELLPAWFRNIREEPNVQVTIGSRTFPAIARVADADERVDLWARLIEQLPALVTYQSRTTRIFPIVLLEGLDSSSDADDTLQAEAQ